MAIFQFAFCRFSRPGSFRGLTHHLLGFLSRREMSHVYPVPVSFNMAKNKSPVGVFFNANVIYKTWSIFDPQKNMLLVMVIVCYCPVYRG